ncbi:hypothetical protein [Chamaesiphon sp. VAR_69_metabat_338]|uniref:hypothetical protein n=1 Tax=Chamaesiphon sp. VAR_69_metabat_338 TaxID=2964704 RepID=UPI00286EAA97|nr:hypothetical protein [Chamaesiphon sp. VAR_69_metabat_338]
MKDKKLDLNALMLSYNFDEYPDPSYLNVKASGFSFLNFVGLALLGAAIFGITHSYLHLSRNYHRGTGFDPNGSMMQSLDLNNRCHPGHTLVLKDCSYYSLLPDTGK